jgi:hypothetical protein
LHKKVAGGGGHTLRERGMVIVNDGKKGRHGLEVMVWRSSREQFDNGTAQTPNIRSRGGARQLDNLWGHPVRGTDNLSFLVGAGQSASRYTKIGKLDFSILSREDIRSFDISMDNTLVVQILEALEHLGHVYADEVLGEFAVSFAYRVKRTILAVFKNNIQTVRRLYEANIFNNIVVLWRVSVVRWA